MGSQEEARGKSKGHGDGEEWGDGEQENNSVERKFGEQKGRETLGTGR